MRIALVITELDPGGAELCLTELALYLAKAGHVVKVWAIGPPPDPSRQVLLQRLTQAGVAVEFGNVQRASHAWRAVRWLKQQLKAFAPDVVQSMLWHANVVTAGALWWSSTPWVGGMRVSEPRSGRWWLERLCSRRMQRLVCVSDDVCQHALKKERIAQEKLMVIPNGVAPRLLDGSIIAGDWQELIQPAPEKVLLFVGRLEPQKGILQLIEHTPEIIGSRREWSLVLMGLGSLQSALQSRIAELGLTKRVHVVGWQPDAPRWIKAADIVLLPAEYEGMPNVLLETMALGKPFVAFAVDGVSQLLSAGGEFSPELREAQLAARNNWPAFLDLAQAQMDYAERRAKCGAANREQAAKNFLLQKQLARYLNLYQQLTKD